MSTFKNNNWLSIATLVLLVANIVTLTLLWTHKKNEDTERKHPPPGPAFEFLTKELQFNAQQQAAFKQLRDQHQESQNKLRDSTRKAKDVLFSLLQQPNVPDSVLQEYSKRAAAFDQQLDMITFRHFQQVRALCDPAQQKKFDAVIKDVMSRMGPPRGQPPPGGPGNHPPPPEEGNHPPPPGSEQEPPPPPQ